MDTLEKLYSTIEENAKLSAENERLKKEMDQMKIFFESGQKILEKSQKAVDKKLAECEKMQREFKMSIDAANEARNKYMELQRKCMVTKSELEREYKKYLK